MDCSETQTHQARLKVSLVVEQQIGVVVDVLPMRCQTHFCVVAKVPLLIDLHEGSVVPSHSAPQMNCHSEQLIPVIGTRKSQQLRVFNVVSQFDQTIVFVPKPLEMQLQ